MRNEDKNEVYVGLFLIVAFAIFILAIVGSAYK